MSALWSTDPIPPNGRWRNRKTGNVRVGWWSYYPPSDRFTVEIKGLQARHVYDETPEYGPWELLRDRK